MMTPIDCDIDINPAVMKPTTNTVVTDELWITAVTNAPVRAPVNRCRRFARVCFHPAGQVKTVLRRREGLGWGQLRSYPEGR